MSFRITRTLGSRLNCIERCYNEREHYDSFYKHSIAPEAIEKKPKKPTSIMILVDHFMELKEEKKNNG